MLRQLGWYARVQKIADTISRMSMIKKTCFQLYHLTCSFEQVLYNVTHLRRVTFACLRLCKGPYMWARRNTLTRTPMSCKARKLTRFNLVSWKLLCALIGSFVYDDPRRQEHKQNTAIGRTWLVRLCTMIREDKNINKTPPLEERDWFVSQFVR